MRRITFILSMIVLIISLGGTVFAAGTNIEGYVTDAQTGGPLPGANVFLTGTSMGAATDAEGKYLIQDIPPGKYTITVSYIGYKSEKLTVDIRQGLTLRQDFKLEAVGVQGSCCYSAGKWTECSYKPTVVCHVG